MPAEPLRPMGVRRRHRFAARALAGAIAAQLAATVALLARGSAVSVPLVTVSSPSTLVPIVLPVPVVIESSPPASPRATHPSCPVPRRDAPPALDWRALPTEVNHVVTAPTNAGWIAAWDTEHVVVSTDAGRSFHAVLDGVDDVRDVTFDCYGHPIVLRGTQIGIRDGGRELWRPVPGLRGEAADPRVLVGGGPDVVVVGVAAGESPRARVAVSPDLGASWWFRDPRGVWELSRATGRQDPDGTIHLALTSADCMSDPVFWVRIQDGAVSEDALGSVGPIELYGDVALVANGGGVQWKRFGEASWREVGGLDPGDPTLVRGPLPRVVVGDVVYALDRDRARALRPWPAGLAPAAVDLAGRLWGIQETIDGESARAVFVDGRRAPIPPPEPSTGNE